MSQKSGSIGFGGFLVGLGIGYLVFRQLNITFNEAAWALIILGVAIVLSAVIRSISPGLGIHRVVGGLAGGLILALILTQGFNLFTGINIGNPFLPYSSTETKTYSGPSIQGVVNLKLGSMNGDITLSTWNRSEYSITSTIIARGTTQQEADNNLANLAKGVIETETTTQQSLTLIYNSQTLVNNPYQIKVDVKLPSTADCKLDASTSNTVTFSIPNFTYSRDTPTSKAGQTSGFDSSQFKISVNAQTSNSEIRIHR